jgi:hypothetical protein
MKKISILAICCFSMAAQASFSVRMPLEINENGSLPDGSIVFTNGNTPTTPEIPAESSGCQVDVMAGTYYLVQEEIGETLTIKSVNGQRISNGTKGKLLDDSLEKYGLLVYELCMNGESPQPYVKPDEIWGNGECKYSTLGDAPPRFWNEVNNANIPGESTFANASIGIGNVFYVGSFNADVVYSNFGTLYDYGRKVNSNSQIIYNGYKYYKGKFIYSIPDAFHYIGDNGFSFKSPVYYYEVCRTQ